MGVIFKNNVMYGAGDIEISPIIYSENEREIGVWTDGRPLYEKSYTIQISSSSSVIVDSTLTFSAINLLPGSTTTIKTTGAYNTHYSGMLTNSRFVRLYTNQYGLNANFENYVSDYGTCTIYIVAQYTKTTDTPGSGIWTPSGVPAVHYSTDEQVVGTWIDGKTIYEITVIGNTISDTSVNVLWERTDIDTIVEYNCIFLDDSNLEYNANYYYSTGAYFRAFVDTRNVWANTKGIVCQRSSNQVVNGTRLTVRYTKSTS